MVESALRETLSDMLDHKWHYQPIFYFFPNRQWYLYGTN